MLLGLFVVSTPAQPPQDSDVSDRALYLWLEKEALSDPAVTNARIQNLVVQGLYSEDREILDHAIAAITLHSNNATRRSYELGSTPVLDRRLQDIPGLYEYLIDVWEQMWHKHNGILPEPTYPTDDPIFVSVSDSKEMMQLLEQMSLAPKPTWLLIPRLLSNLYPKDSKVHEILWDALPDTQQKQRLLIALLAGEFDTPEANAYRIEILNDKDSEWFSARIAAISLGRIQSDEGFDALLARLKDPTSNLGLPFTEIVEAIVAHGKKVLPHADFLRKSVERLGSLATREDEKHRLDSALQLLSGIERRHSVVAQEERE